MENFTSVQLLGNGMPVEGLIGGVLIGLASWGLLFLNGRIAGISGIFGGMLAPGDRAEFTWRALFVAGLIGGMLIYRLFVPGSNITFAGGDHWLLLLAGGFLVGFGTRMGGGCTSGHGVCGIGRLSNRSIVATITFMLTAGLTVFVVRHLIGG